MCELDDFFYYGQRSLKRAIFAIVCEVISGVVIYVGIPYVDKILGVISLGLCISSLQDGVKSLRMKENVRGYAIAGIVISSVLLVFRTVFLIILLIAVGGLLYR